MVGLDGIVRGRESRAQRARVSRAAAIGLAALAAVTVLRCALAACLPLSPDEAYYWIWSRALAAGYPDHPPMVALWIRAGTLIAGQTAFGVRLLAPVSGAIGSLLLADAARLLCPRAPHAGLFAAAALNATLLFGAGTATMTPDTPLLFFWTASLWALARFDASGRGWWLIIAGAASGCALASKYTAAFFGLGAALWFVAVPRLRPWLSRPWPWLAAALGLTVFAPVVVWNVAHGWVSFARQGGRLGDWEPARAARYLGELIGGQIALATPLLFILFTAGVVVAALRAVRTRQAAPALLALLSVPPLVVFAQHALGDRVQANWPAVVYPAAVIAASCMTVLQRWRIPALALGAAITGLIYLQAAFSLFPLPAPLDPSQRQLAGWRNLAHDIAAARNAAGASFVVSDQYGVASELAFYLPKDILVIGNDPRWPDFNLSRPRLAGQTGLVVQSERRSFILPPYNGAQLVPAGEVARSRDGVTVERYRLYRIVWPASADEESALLPHPEG